MSRTDVLALSSGDLASLLQDLDRIAILFAEGFDGLRPKEAMRITKLTTKRRFTVPLIARLAKEYGVDSPSMPLAGLEEDLAVLEKLVPVVGRLAAVHKLLTGLVLSSQARTWKGASTLYALLRAEARNNPILAEALAPAKQALRRGGGKRGPRKAASARGDHAGSNGEVSGTKAAAEEASV
jgi:hypothetical protein